MATARRRLGAGATLERRFQAQVVRRRMQRPFGVRRSPAVSAASAPAVFQQLHQRFASGLATEDVASVASPQTVRLHKRVNRVLQKVETTQGHIRELLAKRAQMEQRVCGLVVRLGVAVLPGAHVRTIN